MVSQIQTNLQPISVNGVVIDHSTVSELSGIDEDGVVGVSVAGAQATLAVWELLRQRAVALELIGPEQTFDDAAFDALLARELSALPQPCMEDCERYYANHPKQFLRNELVYASHILFAVTDGVPVTLLRKRAEDALARVRAQPELFEAEAKAWSNCPSGQVGGSLGQLTRGDSVPEFEAALFGSSEIGLLARLINTRFGFHIVRIDRRVAGVAVPFAQVHEQIADFLVQDVRRSAIRQYVAILARDAHVEGVELSLANGPLVQ